VEKGSFRVSVPEAGDYLLSFYYDPYSYVYNLAHPTYSARIPVTVNQYGVVDLGTVYLSAIESTTVQGALFTAQAEAVPGATVRLGAEINLFQTSSDHTLQNAVFNLKLPVGCELVEESMVFDGQEKTVTENNGSIKVNLGDVALKKGEPKRLNWLVKLAEYQPAGRLVFQGSLDWGPAGGWHKEMATAQVRISKLTLNGPAVVTKLEAVVSGRGPTGAVVRVYDEALLLGEALVSPAGYWYLRVTLPDKGSPVNHRLHAAAYLPDSDFQDVSYRSNTLQVLYDPAEPTLEEVILQQGNGLEFRFKPVDGTARFPYVIVPYAGGIKITLKFNNPDKIRGAAVSVYPFSSEAEKLPNGDYMATVKFSGYELGGVYLSYETKKDPAELNTLDTPTEEQLRNLLPWQLQDSEFEEISEAAISPPEDWPADEVSDSRHGGVKFTLPELPDIQARVEMTVARNTDYAHMAAESVEVSETGIPVYGFKMHGSQITVPSNTYTVWVEGYISQSYLDTGTAGRMGAAATGDLLHVGTKVIFNEKTGKALNAADWGKTLHDGLGIPGKLDELGRLTEQAGNCGGLSTMYRDQLDHLANKLMIGEASKAGLMLAGTLLAPATFGIGTLLLFGASKAMEYAIDRQIDKEIAKVRQDMAQDDECKNEDQNNNNDDNRDDNDNNDRDPWDPRKKKIADPFWIWDPSGIVYEAVPTNTLSGVKATISERIGSGEDAVMVPWDAAWFGQQNPLYTGSNGYYGWDVPPGWWQVTYEKDGYMTAQSEVMDVPPPRTGVDVNLKSLLPPAVAAVTAVSDTAGENRVEILFDRYMLADTLNTGNISLLVPSEDAPDAYDLVPGTVSAVDTVSDPADTDVFLARKARFVPEAPLTAGDDYRLLVRSAVQSYAGVFMGTDAYRTVTVLAAAPPVEEVSGARTEAGDGLITVSWSDPASEYLDQIRLAWKNDYDDDFHQEVRLAKGVETYSITGLANSLEYEIRLTTLDILGRESAGVFLRATPEAESVTPPPPPPPPPSSRPRRPGSSGTTIPPLIPPVVKPPAAVVTLIIGQQSVTVGEQTYTLDALPYIDTSTGRTMVPIRFIGEVLGGQVIWDEATRQIRIIYGDTVILLTLDSRTAFINGQGVQLDQPPVSLPPGRTFVPLRFISEALGATVEYDEATQGIRIVK
jgi:hypothetical protein